MSTQNEKAARECDLSDGQTQTESAVQTYHACSQCATKGEPTYACRICSKPCVVSSLEAKLLEMGVDYTVVHLLCAIDEAAAAKAVAP